MTARIDTPRAVLCASGPADRDETTAPVPKRRYTRLTGDRREAARTLAAELYRSGASIDEVAAELARRGIPVSHGTVHALLVEAKEPRRARFDSERARQMSRVRWAHRRSDDGGAS